MTENRHRRFPILVQIAVRLLRWTAIRILDCPCFLSPPVHRVKNKILRGLLGAPIDMDCFLHSGVRIENWKFVTIEKYAYLAHNATIHASAPVTIGSHSIIGPEAFIIARGHELNSLHPTQDSVHVGRAVFVGARAIILPGVTVGDFAAIGAGSVVTHDVAEGSVVAGNPAVEIGTRPKSKVVWTIFGEKPVMGTIKDTNSSVVGAATDVGEYSEDR